jgi:hypothetical protein
VTAWSGEDLRRAALAALGEHADERARDALGHASITVVEAAGWHGSAGPVQAHRVTLGLDARTLGGLRAAPALADALCAAVASAIATRPGETLLDLHLRWAPGTRSSSAGYRDAPPPAEESSLHDALLEYLEGGGEHLVARSLAGATSDESVPGTISIHLAETARVDFRGHARAATTITAALRDLLANEKLRLRVR